MMSFKPGKKLLVVALVGLVTLSCIAISSSSRYLGTERAKDLLELLYDFDNVNDIDKRYGKIEKLVTDEVFDKVTNLDRTLRAYLKMEGNSSEVVVLVESDDYIIYELKCESITSGRKFMMLFETNIFGKIDKVREVEIVDFI